MRNKKFSLVVASQTDSRKLSWVEQDEPQQSLKRLIQLVNERDDSPGYITGIVVKLRENSISSSSL